MPSSPILSTHHLAKHFGPLRAVQGVDLCVREGEIYGFLGPNGAGKTTTIGMILGLIHPTAGSVELFGRIVSPQSPGELRRVGALVGAPALVPYLSARDNLLLAARLRPDLPARRVEETLEWTGLTVAAGRPAGAFSTGMKQRLGLALALVNRPQLLILDEPTNGMDPAGMREVRLMLAGLAAQGITIFLSSHLLHEVEQICTRVAVLNQGRIAAEGEVKALLGGPQKEHPLVKVRMPGPPENAARAVEVLSRLPGADIIRASGEYVTLGGVSSQAVIRHLVHHDATPSEVVQEKQDLEELFLKLTGERQSAQSAGRSGSQ